MQLPAQLPIKLPRPCFLAGDRVLEIELISDRKSLIYHHGKQREVDRRMLTDESPPPPPRRPPSLNINNCAERLRPRAIARALAREDASRERLIWTTATKDELPGLITATLRNGEIVPAIARKRLTRQHPELAVCVAAGIPPRVDDASTEPDAEQLDLEARREADLRQRRRHLAEADVILSRLPLNAKIDRLLNLLWLYQPAATAAEATPQSRPPELRGAEESALVA